MDNTLRDLLGKIDQTFGEYRIIEKKSGGETASVFLFFSVDLVNSTQFKTVYQSTWVSVFKDFYDMVGAQVKKAFINAEVWKYVGDEVLFYIEARSLEDILKAPSMLYNAMVMAQNAFFREHGYTSCSLYMKSALWMAAVSDGKVSNPANYSQNIYTNLSTGLDFVGIDIDEGFRMSKNVSQGKLVLDPKIVYLLNKHIEKWRELEGQGIEDRVRYVGFEFLKGVWQGRAYPVIWYCDKWDGPDLFLYDEHYTNPLAKEYLSNRENEKDISYINKIFGDLGFLNKRVDMIEEIVNDERIPVQESINTDQLAELHSATVSFDAANNRAMIIKKVREDDPDAREFVYMQR